MWFVIDRCIEILAWVIATVVVMTWVLFLTYIFIGAICLLLGTALYLEHILLGWMGGMAVLIIHALWQRDK